MNPVSFPQFSDTIFIRQFHRCCSKLDNIPRKPGFATLEDKKWRISQDGFQHIAGATRNMQAEVISNLRKMSARVMREAALTGMTRAEVSRHLASELLYAPDAKLRSFQFIDAGGRHWRTEKYFNMLGRTLLHNNAREDIQRHWITHAELKIANLKIEDTASYKLVEDTFKQAINNGDIYKISKYAKTDCWEFFSESFVIYRFEKDKLPEYIIDMIERVAL